MAIEIVSVVGDVVRALEDALEVLDRAAKIAGVVIEMVEVICGTIMAMDLTTSRARRAPSDASNGYSGNVEKISALPSRGKSSRRHHLRVMKVSQ